MPAGAPGRARMTAREAGVARAPSDPGKEPKAPITHFGRQARARPLRSQRDAQQELTEVCQPQPKSLESCSSLSERLAWPTGLVRLGAGVTSRSGRERERRGPAPVRISLRPPAPPPGSAKTRLCWAGVDPREGRARGSPTAHPRTFRGGGRGLTWAAAETTEAGPWRGQPPSRSGAVTTAPGQRH